MEAGVSYSAEDEKHCKIPKMRAEAAKMALIGFENHHPKDMEAEARVALEMDPDCCEAYNLLGFCQPSYEAALTHFLKAIELGPKISPKFDEVVKSNALWDHVPFRAYFRAHMYAANTYRKMGKYKEALNHYLIMTNLDNNFYVMRSSCMATFLRLLLRISFQIPLPSLNLSHFIPPLSFPFSLSFFLLRLS